MSEEKYVCWGCGNDCHNPPESTCDKCLDAPEARIKELEAQLSEFQNGIEIEKANKRKHYQYNCLGDILIVRWHEPSNCWLYYCEEDESDKEFIETHVFPLPSTATKEGE